jgi:ABC-type glycerol-3-phosphate transport system permease component
MDPEVLAFLNRISRSIGIALVIMVLNSTIGIMWGYAYVEDHWKWSNTFFYIFASISLVTLFYTLYKIWWPHLKKD